MRSTILIVDESERIKKSAGSLFEGKDYSVHYADGGMEGLKYAAERPVDAVIIDAGMKRMSGLDTLIYLKHIKPAIPVIMWNDGSDAKLEKEVMEKGASAFFVKPDDLGKLRSLISSICLIMMIRRQK